MGDIITGGQESGYEDLQRALQQARGAEQQYYQKGVGFLQPYQTAGATALGSALGQLGQQADPTAFIRQAETGFQQTPAQRFEQQQATQGVQNLLESQGIAGTGAGAQQLAQTIANITGGQQQQYLQNVLGLRQQTLGDLLSTGQLGAGAAGTAAMGAFGTGQTLAQLLGQTGQAQYGEDVAQGSGINQLLGGLGGLALTGIAGL